MSNRFKELHSFEHRSAECKKILEKYPDKVPVIVTKYEKCKNVDEISKNKFLVPGDLNLAQFVYVIKKRLQLTPEMSLYVFIDEQIPPSSQTLHKLSNEHKDEDGFLYISYASENTFGN